jgi:ribose-phosphate pyrophosphokinase
MGPSPYVLLSSPGMEGMAKAILECLEKRGLELPHYEVTEKTFSCREFHTHVPETVRNQHVFFLHPLQWPDPTTQLFKMLLTNDVMQRADVRGITLVLPYMCYTRQDRKDAPRVPISMRMVARMIQDCSKVEKIITLDLHADQIEGFFDITVDNIRTQNLFADEVIKNLAVPLSDVVVVAPDFGSAKRARKFAKKLGNVPVAIIEKNRPEANVAEVIEIIGASVQGKIVVIYDDMIDTGGTLVAAVEALMKLGALNVWINATHGIFSGNAMAKFGTFQPSLTVTDSIPDFEQPNPSVKVIHDELWFNRISVAPLLADAIYETTLLGGSVSRLSE